MKFMKSGSWIVPLAVVATVGALLAVWQVRRLPAEGVPLTDPLYVGGMLTDGGAPAEGSFDLIVRLYATPSGGSEVCTTAAPGTTVSGGRFRIALEAGCAAAVHANPDLWMEVQVGTTTFPGRIKVGAVPYALESGSAVNAGGALGTRLDAMEARLAALESAPLRPCPAGMVAVGSFCIDRYEASVWSTQACDGTGMQYGATDADDYPTTSFPDNGNFTTPLYACSIPGVVPSRVLTWFQAQQACAASAKHLCTNEEWQTAVAGTYDPGFFPGSAGTCASTSPDAGPCNTCASGPRPAGQAGSVPGGTNDCISMHGAEDMIGNLLEWVAWWGEGGQTWMTSDYLPANPWPAGYETDCTWNVNGKGFSSGALTSGIPVAAMRGGYWANGTNAGAFTLSLTSSPADSGNVAGFRCCAGR
jgi:formylglycine-generating enzyme required for sulfatase activity